MEQEQALREHAENELALMIKIKFQDESRSAIPPKVPPKSASEAQPLGALELEHELEKKMDLIRHKLKLEG